MQLTTGRSYPGGMQRKSFDDMNCSVARSLDVVGEWWTLLVIRDALLGVTRFDDFQERLGISRNVLAVRLDRLVEEGVFEKVPYQERPVRYDYRLTRKGAALWPVLTALREWGDRWITAEDEEPVVWIHDRCGHPCDAKLHCGHCGERLRGSELHPIPGPGATDADFIPVPYQRSTRAEAVPTGAADTAEPEAVPTR